VYKILAGEPTGHFLNLERDGRCDMNLLKTVSSSVHQLLSNHRVTSPDSFQRHSFQQP